jgi:hypothetical protein
MVNFAGVLRFRIWVKRVLIGIPCVKTAIVEAFGSARDGGKGGQDTRAKFVVVSSKEPRR